MLTIIVAVVALVAGFVFGVLFGRKNIATVNAAVASANKEIAVLKADVEKLTSSAKVAAPPASTAGTTPELLPLTFEIDKVKSLDKFPPPDKGLVVLIFRLPKTKL